MSLKPDLFDDDAAHLDALIARAERRLVILADLAEVGMAVVREIARRMVHGPDRSGPRFDPARAFAAASRAVRLTIALEAKVDEQLLAFRKGIIPAELLPPVESGKTPEVSDANAECRPNDEETHRDRRESDPERLVERDRFDLTDFRASVEAIHAGLGLQPDPTLWSNDDLPPSPEVGRADSRLQGGSRVGDRRDATASGPSSDDADPPHRDVPPPGSGLKARVRPPHLGEGRFAPATATAMALALRHPPVPERPPKGP